MATSGNLIQVKDLVKTFESRIHALDHVSLAINQGDVVVIVGPSGSIQRARTIATRCFCPPESWMG